MTQVNSAQGQRQKVASTPHARVRTLAQRRADLERQIRRSLASDATMALTEPQQVSARLKALRKRLGNPTQYKVANDLGVAPRTFQSWENGEVETDRENYDAIARYYSRKLKQKISANWILFGSDTEPPLVAPATSTAVAAENGDTDEITILRQEIAELRAELAEFRTALGAEPGADVLTVVGAARKALEEHHARPPRPSGKRTATG